ncbi:Cyclic nucleotide-binding protein [Pseudocohnilembus persalinus]|uniref:Cyclic nucleotide-binding protein n=1 Tax=Pseudocohnilembus persalinus TaxID=266149 RepID=A0A0V0R977_PSEPJ|nr:Cyclic nucleotide-binding protein [Pseudocohnilembus persalinus]|eukprot:KRX11044.1 Cyclic nucleotide-binding protein [Pseudocohnilembus persalinus]
MLEAITLCHIIATLYYFCGKLQQIYGEENNQNWIVLRNLQYSTPFTQYIQSFYWAIATIMLIGTQGETDIETVFAVLSLLVTVGYFAKILGQVSMVMDQMEQQKKAYKQEKEVMNSFFNIHSDFQPELQSQLHSYLKYSYQGHQKKQISVQFDQLTSTFPEDLQEMIQKERYKEQIQKFQTINDLFSKKVLQKLIMVIKEEYYMPNQIIFQRNEWEEPKLYLLAEGQIELYQETGEIDSTLQVLKPGSVFGLPSFFTDFVPYYSARSCQNSFSTCLIRILRGL